MASRPKGGSRMTVRREVPQLYICNECSERYVGYGDKDKTAMRWVANHNSWHNAGIQENGRWTKDMAPPDGYIG